MRIGTIIVYYAQGRYWSGSWSHLGPPPLPGDLVFSVMQEDDEDSEAFQERVRNEARERGMLYVVNLDESKSK